MAGRGKKLESAMMPAPPPVQRRGDRAGTPRPTTPSQRASRSATPTPKQRASRASSPKLRQRASRSVTPSPRQARGRAARSVSPKPRKGVTRQRATRSMTPTRKPRGRAPKVTSGKSDTSKPQQRAARSTTPKPRGRNARQGSVTPGPRKSRASSPKLPKPAPSTSRSATPLSGRGALQSATSVRGRGASRSATPLRGRGASRSATPVRGRGAPRSVTPLRGRGASRSATPLRRASRSVTPLPGLGASRASTPIPAGSRAATPKPQARTLKTVETQTPSRRPSLQPPPQKRVFSPYTTRSESPAIMLRNGKLSRNSSFLLDGIPITKRTRSMISDSDASSIKSGQFNDTASSDGFFTFQPPDSPFDLKQNAFVSQFSVSMTPTRGRRLSETSSVSSSVANKKPQTAAVKRKSTEDLAPAAKKTKKETAEKLPGKNKEQKMKNKVPGKIKVAGKIKIPGKNKVIGKNKKVMADKPVRGKVSKQAVKKGPIKHQVIRKNARSMLGSKKNNRIMKVQLPQRNKKLTKVGMEKKKVVEPEKLLEKTAENGVVEAKKDKKKREVSAEEKTLETLLAASKILEQYAAAEHDDSNDENESNPKTPVPMSPRSTSNMSSSSKVEASDGSYVSPLNNLANKLRTKLGQSPPKMRGLAPVTPMGALPIINSLSAAAKQTSSFLRQVDTSEASQNAGDVPYKLNNKALMFRKMENKQLNNTIQGAVSNILMNKKSPSYKPDQNGEKPEEAKVLDSNENHTIPEHGKTEMSNDEAAEARSTTEETVAALLSPEKRRSIDMGVQVDSPLADPLEDCLADPLVDPLALDSPPPEPVVAESETSAESQPAPDLAQYTLPSIPDSLEDVVNRGPRIPSLPYEEEDLAAKVSVLGALGLTSNRNLAQQIPKVPKIRLVCRTSHKKHRRSANHDSVEKTYTVCREGDPLVDWDSPTKSVAKEPSPRTLLWIPRMPISNGKSLDSYVDGSTPEPGIGVGDGLDTETTEGSEKSSEPLVIPEKSSSFAIHPARLCDDVCCYCHNKFGLYDTPLHVAQLKGDDKQSSVLAREPLLSLESCLCDACFRHLDRPVLARPPKAPVVAKLKPQPNLICCYVNCYQPAAHPMMRKWKRRARTLLKEDQQQQNGKANSSSWICDTHYSELARIGCCGMCKRRLSSQQMYKMEGSAVPQLNKLLRRDLLPITVDSSMSVCKKCRFYTTLRLRSDDHMALSLKNRILLREHRTRLLKSMDVDPATVPEVFAETEKPKRQPKKRGSPEPSTPPSPPLPIVKQPRTKVRMKVASPVAQPATPPQPRRMPTNARMSAGNSPRFPPQVASKVAGLKLPSQTRITLQPCTTTASTTVQISPVLSRLAERGDLRRVATQNALSSRVSISKFSGPSATVTSAEPPQVTIVPVGSRSKTRQVSQEFPSISDVGLTAKIEFQQQTPQSSNWEKVNATFQFDRKTRELWENLQAPYGSYTSFLRHMVLLESHWRSGDLVMSPHASPRAIQYLGSVQNRIEAYESVPSEPDISLPLISEVRSLANNRGGSSEWNKI